MRNTQSLLSTLVTAVILFVGGIVRAQDAAPAEMLLRTVMIRHVSGQVAEQGTAFAIDHDGKFFLVTARHVVAGLPPENPAIQMRRNGEWLDLHVKKILLPSSNAVDIAVLKTDEEATSYAVQPAGVKSAIMGQQVWFLGFPFPEGLGSHWSTREAPFIKRGTLSAVDASNPDAIVIYIDGFNNKGFSGGPIVYWSLDEHVYKILGVVQGYKNDNAQVVINDQTVDTNLLVNSGILVGYSIEHAIQAIEKDANEKK